ncbi:hypothetical protein N9Y92_01810 [Chlamydiales bacterium]|nr:hypothetical protein [Chlamydiales bacterium]
MHKLTLILYLLPALLFSQEVIQLKNKIGNSQIGDYFVTMQEKEFTLWHIRDKKPGQILIEEIMAPAKRVILSEEGWQGWINQGAPYHTGWVMYAVDLQSGRLLSLFSIDHKKWCHTEESSRFFSTFLNVPFYQVPMQNRRRVGPKPPSYMADQRVLWSPPLFREGKQVYNVPFKQYMTRWPSDGTPLAGKEVEIFLPTENYPDFFPYWLQVNTKLKNAQIRMLDSGSNLQSPIPAIWSNDNLSTNK